MALKASRFLNPKADLVFKRIFGEHKHLLMSFLNALMPLPKDTIIEEVQYLTPEQVPVIPDFRRTIVDVKCFDQFGRTFIVEMQMEWIESFASHLLYGSAQAYVYQLNRGEPYKEICPVYGLGLINAIFDKGDEWYHHYKMTNVKNTKNHIDGIELVLLELPKFKPTTPTEKKLTALWLHFLNEAEKFDEIPEDFKDYPELVEAMELSQEARFTRAQLEYYNSYWDAVSTERSLMVDAFDKGREEGRMKEKLKIAKALKVQGMSSAVIVECTGLSLNDIENIF